jgi:DnaJ-class molecular chaperone
MDRTDPYLTLGIKADASDAEVRVAYRRLVQLHHPDHNGGSPESARRFEAVQEAYAQITSMRGGRGPSAHADTTGGRARASGDNVASRLADIERELKAAREARERELKAARERVREAAREAQRAAREAQRAARNAAGNTGSGQAGGRASDEELGYVTTDDSFSKILSDAASDLSDRFSQARERQPKHLADLLDDLASKLTGEPPDSER